MPYQGDPSYWADGWIPRAPDAGSPAPEVPQLPDVAFEVTCAQCRHTLDRHVLDDVHFADHENGHKYLALVWVCNTALSSVAPSGLQVITHCPCAKFQPAEQYTRAFRQEPLL